MGWWGKACILGWGGKLSATEKVFDSLSTPVLCIAHAHAVASRTPTPTPNHIVGLQQGEPAIRARRIYRVLFAGSAEPAFLLGRLPPSGKTDALEARKNERSWLRHRDNGDLDDSRLIDGLTGDRNVYKVRGERPPEQGSTPVVPKRIHFLFDLSMSMSRYSMDGRLQVR